MTANYEKSYLAHLKALLEEPVTRPNRTGVCTSSIFGHKIAVDLREGFPLLSTKSIHWKSVLHELLWFVSGSTNINYLKQNGVRIWDEWADENGDLGPVYGKQWRDFGGVDQLSQVIDSLKSDPYSRRHIVNAWNPVDLPDMALAPCHVMFQFNVAEIPSTEIVPNARRMAGSYDDREAVDNLWCRINRTSRSDGEKIMSFIVNARRMGMQAPTQWLDCLMYQRSADWFLGVPFNTPSYSLLTHMVAQVVGMAPRHFVHCFGDTHLYENHAKQAKEQLSRTPSESVVTLNVNPKIQHIDEFTAGDFDLVNYNPMPAIKAKVAV